MNCERITSLVLHNLITFPVMIKDVSGGYYHGDQALELMEKVRMMKPKLVNKGEHSLAGGVL